MLVPFLSALLIGLPLIYAVREVCIQRGYVAKPRADRWHRRPTATLGGVGIFGAFWAAVGVYALVGGALDDLPWGILLGASVIFLLGLYDDLRELSPASKLGGQFLAAAVVISFGYTTAFFTPRLDDPLLAQTFNILLTFFWLVGITNAINLLDNMDGLAGGIALITALFLAYFFAQGRSAGFLVIAAALAGALLAFLRYNFPPATIFMGDSGSLFLGFTLAALAIARRPQASSVLAVMGVPTLLFMLPILDTTLVTFTRILRGQSPAQGGRDHTSHRLIAFGLSERQSVLALYGVALAAGLAGLAIENLDYWLSLALAPVVVIALALLTAYLGGMKVVVSPTLPAHNGGIARIMLELTLRRRILEVVLDFFLIGIAFYLAFLASNGFRMNPAGLALFVQALPVAVGGAYASFALFGVYRGVWRYIGVGDLVQYVWAAGGGVALCAVVVWLLGGAALYPLSLFVYYAVLLWLGLAATRSSFRILDLFSQRQRVRPAEQRVLIYGAGDAGELALRWIMMNPALQYRPVGFVDANAYLAGRIIHGVEVLGPPARLDEILMNYDVDGLILIPGAVKDEASALEACRRAGCWARSLRLEFELLD